jgi:hypothetical protein
VAYVTVTRETSNIAFGTNYKHYEGKNKRTFSVIRQLMNKYDCYAGTKAKTHRSHHFATLNQQNAQYSSLDLTL